MWEGEVVTANGGEPVLFSEALPRWSISRRQ
jgi:hypothetical protein